MRFSTSVKLFSVTLIVFPVLLLGQVTFRGTITDSTTNETLIGANVVLDGTPLGCATDRDGMYKIVGIPPGVYKARFAYLGYATKILEVDLTQAEVKILNVRLAPEVIEGAEVVVTAQMRGQNAAINQQLTSKTIVNVISEERIKELPDVNAAEAIGRLPGVALQRSGGEANKVVLRGLSDKFSSVTLDGIRIAATDVDSRGVDLSTVSQGTLAGIELYKALTPDKDADAIAGSVNLVTRKAPSERVLQLDLKGDYNKIKDNFKQYDFGLRYGERFFDDLLGVQATGNLEQRDRSNERMDLDYNMNRDGKGTDYEITNFTLGFIDEICTRRGFSLLLDVNTPDDGSIKINNIYNWTKRDYIDYARNYPTSASVDLIYSAQNKEIEIETFTSSIRGENHPMGLDVTWGVSFAQSLAQNPYDFYMDFVEPSTDSSKMKTYLSNYKGSPETLIPLAFNNYKVAYANWAYFRGQKNLEIEKTAFLDIAQQYVFGDLFTGELKLGGKYKHKYRFKETSSMDSPYYIDGFRQYTMLPDGSVGLKSDLFRGTRFADLLVIGRAVSSINFTGASPDHRNVFGLYDLNPLILRDALRDWYTLNKNGVSTSDGKDPEFKPNNEIETDYYDIFERVSAGYVMNTLNVGQFATLIAGVRMEQEKNDYRSKYTPHPLTGFPTPSGLIEDTSATYSETIWLPNVHLTMRPTDFLNVRFAAYRALARPDFKDRLEFFVARQATGVSSIEVGNPNLRSAKAWNFEVNTSLFSATTGLFAVSAFYKDVTDMFHIVNNINLTGREMLDSLGIRWQSSLAQGSYTLTYPYNSSQPTRVWGFEVEHQANLNSLPGYLQFLVLNYNFSIVRSETYVTTSKVVKFWRWQTRPPMWVEDAKTVLTEVKQKLEGQPEFFGNAAIGYDIYGFSTRLSVFYQSEYNLTFSGDGRTDQIVDSFTRWDLAFKYKYSQNLSIMLNVNNLTSVREDNDIQNRITNWRLLDTGNLYGMTVDLGLRLSL
jgi:TonB-dependent receptor